VTRREGDPDLKGWFGFGRKVSGSYPPPVAKGRLGTKQPPSTYETNAPSGPFFRREPPRKRGQVFGGQSSRQTLLRKFNPHYYFDGAVIVTMPVMRMMQVAINEIIYVVAVRHRLVSATGSMLMTGLMTATIMIGCATLRVLRTDFQGMFLYER